MLILKCKGYDWALRQQALNQGRFGQGWVKSGTSPGAQTRWQPPGLAGPSETLISCSTTVYLFRDLSTTSKVSRSRSGETFVEYQFGFLVYLLHRRSIISRCQAENSVIVQSIYCLPYKYLFERHDLLKYFKQNLRAKYTANKLKSLAEILPMSSEALHVRASVWAF